MPFTCKFSLADNSTFTSDKSNHDISSVQQWIAATVDHMELDEINLAKKIVV